MQGFFKVDAGHRQPAATPWLCVKGTAANPPLDQYYLSKADVPTAIQTVNGQSLNSKSSNRKSYDLSGRRVAYPRKGQVYVVDGEKIAH